MTSKWFRYSRFGINAASMVTSVGFSAAKSSTHVGFSLARGVMSTVAGIAGYPFGMGPVLGGAVSIAFTLVEHLALAPIIIGETLTSTSLVAAESSIDLLSSIFPGSDEASFSLGSFVALVRREWNDWQHLPGESYSIAEIGKALISWAALQGVTQEWKEDGWFKVLKEIDVNEIDEQSPLRQRKESRIRITSDAILPKDNGQLITAEITEEQSSPTRRNNPRTQGSRKANFFFLEEDSPIEPGGASLRPPSPAPVPRISHTQLKSSLRRFSKMVLGGYGGASLIFFGVSLSPPPWRSPSITRRNCSDTINQGHTQDSEESMLMDVVDASEREASSSAQHPAPAPTRSETYSWWNVLLGRHDRDIFEGYAVTPATVRGDPRLKNQSRARRGSFIGNPNANAEKAPTIVVGAEKSLPRFWVLTDHGRRQVVLVFRGTMSLNELAVDLTCEPAPFVPYWSCNDSKDSKEDKMNSDCGDSSDDSDPSNVMPGSLPFRRKFSQQVPDVGERSEKKVEGYIVHGGMLRMARAMGGKGRPVHRAVRDALQTNDDYELILTGHSLGAGVAALLALTWANPATCLTVASSGLPVGRKVSAYCYAPPCLACPALSKLANPLVTSFVYSHDVVSRLSLGSMRDMKSACAWLCEAEKNDTRPDGLPEGYSTITRRVTKWHAGLGTDEDKTWFLSIRKTLEASMTGADLFPPGLVLWAIRDGDLSRSHRIHYGNTSNAKTHGEKVRLFEVTDVEKVFGQITFAGDMLSSHLPHQYDRVLHELL